VGHAGTLDPLATGVLLVCIGPACKRAQEFQDHDKEYVAGIRFGATTPSYDLEKEVDRTFPYDGVTEEALRAVLPSFLGTQEQVAPLFSAKSVDGVRAYEMARKMYRKAQAGTLDPDFDAAALETLHHSTITISDIELLDFSTAPSAPLEMTEGLPSTQSTASSRINVADTSTLGLPEAHIRIACSKGTYIRAFARDLGEALGTGAHLSSLVRTKTGAFRLEDALSLDQALALLAED
jgi:Pseudouridine synthase